MLLVKGYSEAELFNRYVTAFLEVRDFGNALAMSVFFFFFFFF